MGLTIRETSCTPKRVLTLPHCNWYNLSGVKETILRGYWHPAFSPIDVLSQMLTTARSSSQFTADKMQAGSRKQRQVNLYVASSPVNMTFFSFSMQPYILYLFPYGMVSIETEVAQKKKRKLYQNWVSYFFFQFLSLTLLLSLSVSLSLPCSLKVKQRVDRSISLINTTQQHSALWGEMKRHGGMSTCRPGLVLTNDTYHTSHGWEQGRGRRDKVGLERQTERDR